MNKMLHIQWQLYYFLKKALCATSHTQDEGGCVIMCFPLMSPP